MYLKLCTIYDNLIQIKYKYTKSAYLNTNSNLTPSLTTAHDFIYTLLQSQFYIYIYIFIFIFNCIYLNIVRFIDLNIAFPVFQQPIRSACKLIHTYLHILGSVTSHKNLLAGRSSLNFDPDIADTASTTMSSIKNTVWKILYIRG